jgi:hypothetical protein
MATKHDAAPDFLEGIAPKKWLREQTSFLAISLKGMSRHPYLSEDWIAHNTLHGEAFNTIAKLVGAKDADTIQRRILAWLKRGEGERQ